jgi:uncharacterized membrane protein YeaQ/YmgE (transglycosylase-associated protein family)
MTLPEFGLLLIVGALAGWLAGVILGRRGFGFPGDLVIGVAGSFLGRYVLGVVGFHATTTLAQLISAVIGSLLLLWLLSLLPRRGKRK